MGYGQMGNCRRSLIHAYFQHDLKMLFDRDFCSSVLYTMDAWQNHKTALSKHQKSVFCEEVFARETEKLPPTVIFLDGTSRYADSSDLRSPTSHATQAPSMKTEG